MLLEMIRRNMRNDPVDELLSYATEDDLKILSLIGAEHKHNAREKTAHRKSGLLR